MTWVRKKNFLMSLECECWTNGFCQSAINLIGTSLSVEKKLNKFVEKKGRWFEGTLPGNFLEILFFSKTNRFAVNEQKGPYNRRYLATLRFLCGCREIRRLPRSKNNKNNKINCKLIFGSRSSYLAASPGIFHLFLQPARLSCFMAAEKHYSKPTLRLPHGVAAGRN